MYTCAVVPGEHKCEWAECAAASLPEMMICDLNRFGRCARTNSYILCARLSTVMEEEMYIIHMDRKQRRTYLTKVSLHFVLTQCPRGNY